MSGSAVLPQVVSSAVSPEVVKQAAIDAASAAAGSGVRIELADDIPRLDAVARFFAEVWLTPQGQPPLPSDVMRTIVHAGGTVHTARSAGELVGAAVMIFCPPGSGGVYSVIAAARRSDRGVGFALKQAQRACALERGATSMMWTFDPLMSRNARFNLVKLGAVALDYAVNFYGPLNDGIDGQGDTDRLVAVWSLAGPRAVSAAKGRHSNVVGPDLSRVQADPAPAPDGGPLTANDQDGRWCRVPPDILAVRRGDQPLADQWRLAVREALLPALAEGLAATGFSRDGWYRLAPRAAVEGQP